MADMTDAIQRPTTELDPGDTIILEVARFHPERDDATLIPEFRSSAAQRLDGARRAQLHQGPA